MASCRVRRRGPLSPATLPGALIRVCHHQLHEQFQILPYQDLLSESTCFSRKVGLGLGLDMVLDLATMKLATFKDFGNFGGSLTWAMYHDDHW